MGDRMERMNLAAMRSAHACGELDDIDIDVLFAEVDRLTAENDVLRTEIANITASKRAQP